MAIAVGSKAPAFELESSEGGKVSLASVAGKPTVLYFYPKDFTGGCTTQAENFRDAMPALKALGAAVYGISKDSIATHCKFRDKHTLTFPLLTDADGAVMTKYGAWGEKTMYGKKVTGTIRSTVLLDGEGKVVQHWPKVKVAGHADAVIAAVKALVSGESASEEVSKPAAKAAKKPAKKSVKKPATKAKRVTTKKQPAKKRPKKK